MNYFGYGTLLDLETMLRTAPSARSLGVMRLEGYRLGFARCPDGKSSGCTLEPAPGAVTYGVQYELSDEDMARMDAGAISGDRLWQHKRVTLQDADGHRVESLTYVIAGTAPAVVPTGEYVRPILKGLNDLDFPGSYAEQTVKRIAAIRGEA